MGNALSKFTSNKRGLSYAGIILVVILWGVSPLISKFFLSNGIFSSSILKMSNAIIAVIALLIICRKKLKLINMSYIKVAVPTGIFYALGEILQKIGLKYTTPTTSAFLENLSVVVVPILMLIFIKKKPTLLKILASIVCLGSAFVLSFGLTPSSFGFGVGEILCALAGISYGVNIAGTGAFAKKLDSALYILIQMAVTAVISAIVAVILNFVCLPGESTPIEPAKFTFSAPMIIFLICETLLISTCCWLIRTAAMKHVDATVVAIIMPFSAVITGISSCIVGYDTISLDLIIGAILGFAAIMISSISDIFETRRQLRNFNKPISKTANEAPPASQAKDDNLNQE